MEKCLWFVVSLSNKSYSIHLQKILLHSSSNSYKITSEKLKTHNITLPVQRGYSKSSKTFLNELLMNMPKTSKILLDLQVQRQKVKEKQSQYVPGRVTLQVLGTGAKGAPRSLYVFSDQTRYIFNCGEGTQRLSHELKLKLSKVEHIFITHPVWQNVGGLPGTTLTMQDVGVGKLSIHGPEGMSELFDATKKFVILKNLKISFPQCKETDYFEDNVLSVLYVPLSRKLEVVPEINAEDSYGEMVTLEENAKITQFNARLDTMVDESTSTRSKSPSAATSTSTASAFGGGYKILKEKGVSMAYICHLKPRPGSLNIEKCVEKGVQPGPLLGKLKAGQDVMLSNGTIVKSSEVREPDDPGPIFIVVDCPTEEYINSLVTNDIFRKYQKFAETPNDIAALVVHFSPRRVMEEPRYQSWMNFFTPETQHLILNESNTCMGSASVHRLQYKLNLLSDRIFPLLADKGTDIVEEEEASTLTCGRYGDPGSNDFANKLVYGKTLSAIHLRPRKGLDRSEELKLVPTQYVTETRALDNFSETVAELKRALSLKGHYSVLGDYPKILFLGTGSCIPNKTRNTSGILIQIDPECNIFLDCGEGTYGQLIRFFGKAKGDEILAHTKAIYVSHIHADHHIGLVGLLLGRKRAIQSSTKPHLPLTLFAPLQLFPWLMFYDRSFEPIKPEFDFVSNSDIIHDTFKFSQIYYNKILRSLRLKEINTCLVKHCPHAYGVTMTFEDNRKLTYSGDTMPCAALVQLGMHSDVLIHEATMEDELSFEAIAKMHSTTTQAINVAKEMNAKNLILTHFSQRYAKLPRFPHNFDENVGVAFDNMWVKMSDLRLLPLFIPSLKLLFAEEHEELEARAMKRLLRMEKEKVAERHQREKMAKTV